MAKKITLTQLAEQIRQGFQSSTERTTEFSTFSKHFKSAIKQILDEHGATLKSYSIGHFYVSGFYEKNGKIGYFSLKDVRSETPSLLYRTAAHEKDYTGGQNNHITLDHEQLGSRMLQIIN